MSDNPSDRQRFELKPIVPIRALALASAAAVVGAALIVVSSAADWPVVVTVLGVILLVLGAALTLMSLLLITRVGALVLLTPDELTVRRGKSSQSMAWSQVASVDLSGPRLTVTAKAGEPKSLTIVNPRTTVDPVFLALVTELQRRLDADRGYQPLR